VFWVGTLTLAIIFVSIVVRTPLRWVLGGPVRAEQRREIDGVQGWLGGGGGGGPEAATRAGWCRWRQRCGLPRGGPGGRRGPTKSNRAPARTRAARRPRSLGAPPGPLGAPAF